MKRNNLTLRCVLLCGVAGFSAFTSSSYAVETPFVASGFHTSGYSDQPNPSGFSTTLISLGTNNGAVAYAPNGTLYVVQGSFNSPSNTIEVVNSNGTLGTPIAVQDTSSFNGFGSIGGVAWDTQTNSLLVTDSDGGDFLYQVPVTGAVSGGQIQVTPTTLLNDPTFSTVPFISQVAVRSNGDIFVGDSAGGPGSGGPGAAIFEINRSTGAATPVVQTNQDFIGGIGFDSLGHMIYQAGAFNFSGGPSTADVNQVLLSGTGAGTTVGAPQLLSSATGSFDLAVTSGNHVLTSGVIPQSSDGGTTPYTFGLFQPGLASNATSSLLTYPTSSSSDFGESLAYLPGTSDFTANSGAAGGQVAIVLSDFSGAATGIAGNNFVEIIRPVPEPATAVLLALSGLALLPCYARRRRAENLGRGDAYGRLVRAV